MTILLAVGAGAGLGYVLQRGEFCFHSTWRGLFTTPRRLALVRSYLVILLICTPIVQLMVALEVIDPFVPPFAWRASLTGGLLFGVGMVIASTCISGMFYKLGAGMLGTVTALAAWVVGDLLVYRGPLQSFREELIRDPVTVTSEDGSASVATVTSVLGPAGVVVIVVLGAVASWYLWSHHRRESGMRDRGPSLGWLTLGLATAGVLVVTWLLVRWHGSDYTFGTSSVPSQLTARIVDGDSTALWIPLALVSIVPGAHVAARRTGTVWVRGERPARHAQLAVGGVVMGIGAGIAGGCNVGHSMVGVPLLSLGSILTTLAMIGGVFVAHSAKAALAPVPSPKPAVT